MLWTVGMGGYSRETHLPYETYRYRVPFPSSIGWLSGTLVASPGMFHVEATFEQQHVRVE